MILIDTHTHFYDEAFDLDRQDAIQRAFEANVQKMIVPACSENSVFKVDNLCEKYKGKLFPAIGLHPEDIKDNFENQLDIIFNSKLSTKPIAVGEIGIDLYWRQDNFDIQSKVFEIQIQKAIDMNLPILIHCRNAYNEVIDILKQYSGKISGIFHCFCGTEKNVEDIYKIGNFKFGVGGVITFKNSGAKTAKIVSELIDLKDIVLETDSPYIAPVPHRGKRNESAFMINTAQKLAELKNVTFEQVANQTTKNAETMFNI